MSKIYNAFLKNTELLTAEGKIQFDAECVAEVTNKNAEEILLGLPNYHKIEEEASPEPPVEEEVTKEQEPTETVEEKKVEKKDTTTKATSKK